MLKVGELKIYVGVRAEKWNTRSQGHAAATRPNDTFRCLKRGKVRKVIISVHGASENPSKIWGSAVPEKPPLMSTAKKDAEKHREMHRI